MWTWIILGSLILIVMLFMIIMGIKDKRKQKEIVVQRDELDKLKADSSVYIAIWMGLLKTKNELALKNFVPSVGKIKMSDIKNMSKESFKLLKTRREYAIGKDVIKNKKYYNALSTIENTSPNLWEKKLEKEFLVFSEVIKDHELTEHQQTYERMAKQMIGEIYELTK